MPLTDKGEEILKRMVSEYGTKGESIFYASRNAETITGVDSTRRDAVSGSPLGFTKKELVEKYEYNLKKAKAAFAGAQGKLRESIQKQIDDLEAKLRDAHKGDSSSLAALPDGISEKCDTIIARCDGGKKGEVAHLKMQLRSFQQRLKSAIAQRDAEEINSLREQIEKAETRIKDLS